MSNRFLTLTCLFLVFLSLEVNSWKEFEELKTKLLNCFASVESRRQKLKRALVTFFAEAFSAATPAPSLPGLEKHPNKFYYKIAANEYPPPPPKEHQYIEKLNTPQFRIPNGKANLRLNMNKEESVYLHGYTFETHTVLTFDGYKLTVNRIQQDTGSNINNKNDKIVLLHHGLLGSSIDWLFLGPNKSLPYLLSDEGYDVWLTNARGNKYSKNHVKIKTSSRQFWNFSLHEIGHLDLSAVIDYIRECTHKNSLIHFIGHSMGATAALVLLSTTPHYNLFLESLILLAPLAFMYKVKGPLLYISEAKNIEFLGKKDFVERFPDDIIVKYCDGGDLCLNPWLLMANGGNETHIGNVKAQIQEHSPGGGSTKTVLHYAQLIRSGKFQMFDYGPKQNTRIYGSALPPEYPLSKISTPVVLFSSIDDWLASTEAVARLAMALPRVVAHYVIARLGFTHVDFLWADEAPLLIYTNVLNTIKKMQENSKLVMTYSNDMRVSR